MSDLVIVDAELRSLAADMMSASEGVGASSNNVATALSEALSSMPGSSSKSSIVTAGDTVDARRTTVKNRYDDLSMDVTAAVNSFAANERAAEESLHSAGALVGETTPYGSISSRLAERLG